MAAVRHPAIRSRDAICLAFTFASFSIGIGRSAVLNEVSQIAIFMRFPFRSQVATVRGLEEGVCAVSDRQAELARQIAHTQERAFARKTIRPPRQMAKPRDCMREILRPLPCAEQHHSPSP